MVEQPAAAQAEVQKMFTQDDVNRIVEERLARTHRQYADYEELKKFRETHSQEQEKIRQEELIKQKKFEEAETTYKKQLAEREQLLSQKDMQIQDMTIRNHIVSEATKMNGFVDETVAMVRSQAYVGKDGNVVMKVRDANGIEKEVGLDEGLKTFYSSRPHLVKASGGTGGGTATSSGAGAGKQGGESLMDLNNQFIKAHASGQAKLASELRQKMMSHPDYVGGRRGIM